MQVVSEDFYRWEEISVDNPNRRSFDDLPSEVLVRIIQYFANSPYYLRRLQQVNKRWKLIAETYLYQTLTLCGHDSSGKLSFAYFQLLLRPERCKLVKNLYLESECFLALNENFFNTFPNIQRVCSRPGTVFDWKYFNMKFTPDRYKLRELPYPPPKPVELMAYFDALESHRQTLETLDIVEADSRVMEQLANINYLLPSLKLFKASTLCKNVKILDAAINKFPRLEKLDMNSASALDWRKCLSDVTQHQQMMRRVSGHGSGSAFQDMCSYLAVKFPNVYEWHLKTASIREADFLGPFEEMADLLYQITKSEKVDLRFTVDNSIIPEATNFLLESCGVQRSVSIGYDLYDDEDIEEEENYDSDGDFGREYIEEEDWNIASICVTSNSGLATWMDPKIVIRYMPDDFYHLALLERIGPQIQALQLSLHCDERHNFNMRSGNAQQIWQGGALAHLINNCPKLLYLTYKAEQLKNLCPKENEIKVNKSLRVVKLMCQSIERDQLLKLSYCAPNIECLYMSQTPSCGTEMIEINMPYNNFEQLEIGYVSFNYYYNPLIHAPTYTSTYTSTYASSYYILVQIVLTTHREEPTWYCLEISEKVFSRGFRKIERQEYIHHVNSNNRHREIAITCKSIKCLKLPHIYLPGTSTSLKNQQLVLS